MTKIIPVFVFCEATNELAYYDVFDEIYVILGEIYEKSGYYFFRHNHQQPTDGKGNTFATPINKWVGKIYKRKRSFYNFIRKHGYIRSRWGVCE